MPSSRTPQIAAGTLLLLTLMAVAQDNREFTIPVRVNVVEAPTTVTDKDGSYITGIKPSEFRLFDNGKLQNIEVHETAAPISLVVAIQSDAKVESVIPKIQRIGNLLETLVAGDQGEVAIVAFDHRIEKLQDFTSDTNKIQESLKKMRPGSSSSRMIDAVVESVRMLRSRPKERRRVVLLISESRDKSSEAHVREALTATQMEDVLVYALNMSRLYTEFTAKPEYPRPDPIPSTARHMPAGVPQTPTAAAQMTGTQGYGANFAPMITEIFRAAKAIFVDNPVEVFTKYTGGREIPFVSQRDLERAVSEIGREIHNQYIVTYNPDNKEDGGFHQIHVEVQRRNLNIRTRPGYWMAAVVK
ncbi:MAG TPA: VWA domain-containing protein [Bryobacteraceae bacterium]|nr:VWA domain-containing protein [Bryobacteraceae bacterium]